MSQFNQDISHHRQDYCSAGTYTSIRQVTDRMKGHIWPVVVKLPYGRSPLRFVCHSGNKRNYNIGAGGEGLRFALDQNRKDFIGRYDAVIRSAAQKSIAGLDAGQSNQAHPISLSERPRNAVEDWTN